VDENFVCLDLVRYWFVVLYFLKFLCTYFIGLNTTSYLLFIFAVVLMFGILDRHLFFLFSP